MIGEVITMTGEQLEQAAAEAERLVEESGGQMAIDMTLDSERSMKDNLETIIDFCLQTIMNGDASPDQVRNRHEAYGIAAEDFCQVEASVKKIKTDMNKLLGTLGDPNFPALEAVGALLNSATLAAMDVITMAAEMKRTMTDLYAAEQYEPTPMEALAESGGGFEEAGEPKTDSPYNNEVNAEENRCTTGLSRSGYCGAARQCPEPYECCAECPESCNSRCGWLDNNNNQEDE